MPLLTPSEKSALEMMLRNKLGSGVGTSALLKVIAHVDTCVDVEVPAELAAEVVALVNEHVAPEPSVEVTESSP